MRNYITAQGDTWDLISFKQYGSEKYVDILIEANWPLREQVIFEAGSRVNVPAIDLQISENRNLPPWRRNR